MNQTKCFLLAFACILPLLLVSCDATSQQESFTLQLLHVADMDGDGVAAVIDNAPHVSAIVNQLRTEHPNNTLFLSSGDNFISGPTFSASDDESLRPLLGVKGAGRGDIVILNEIGVQASAFGNHEFDNGSDDLAQLIAAEEKNGQRYPGTAFPYLSTNIDFSADSDLGSLVVTDGQEASTIPNSIAGSTVITVAGERIGVVGATTPLLAAISSPSKDAVISPTDPNNFDALAAAIQLAVDALTATGINKIILLAHMQQFAIEDALTSRLRDVDILVAGGSNTILADNTDRLRPGDSAFDTYPLIRTSASGEPMALVNCGFDYRYVCRLVVDFDNNGILQSDSIEASKSGSWATDEQGLTELNNPKPDPEVVAISQAISEVLIGRESNTFGKTTVFLEGRRSNVRTEETNFGNLSADANLATAQMFDETVTISLKNGGSIRAEIGVVTVPPGATDSSETLLLPPSANSIAGKEEGQISQFDIQNSLRFNNDLVILTVTAQELVNLLEHGVAETALGATPGRFPQISGIRFSFDPELPVGSRVRSLLVLDSNGMAEGGLSDQVVVNGVLQGNPKRTFRIVTLGFLADGGDSYPFPATNRVDLCDQILPKGNATFVDSCTEQDSLAEYLVTHFPDNTPFSAAETPPEHDERIQNLSVRSDTIFSLESQPSGKTD